MNPKKQVNIASTSAHALQADANADAAALPAAMLLAITFYRLSTEMQHSLIRTARAHRESSPETWARLAGAGETLLCGAFTQELRARFPDATRELLLVLRRALLSAEVTAGILATIDLPGIQADAISVLSQQWYEKGGFESVRRLVRMVYGPLFPIVRRIVDPQWIEHPGAQTHSARLSGSGAGAEDVSPALVGLRDWVLANTHPDAANAKHLRQRSPDGHSAHGTNPATTPTGIDLSV